MKHLAEKHRRTVSILSLIVLLILFILLIQWLLVVSPTPDLEERINRIENEMAVFTAKGLLSGETTTLTKRMEHYNVPGVSIAVINNYEIEWAKGFGVADAKENNPVTPDTLFQAASISKPATAMAALYLVEQGILDLDQDVNDRLVSWQVPENDFTTQEKVTLRRLLSHTAGFNEGAKFGYFQSEKIPTLQQVLDGENPAHSPPWRVEAVPGALWRYSNGGYVTVAQLLMDVTGKPFPEIMQGTVFTPLHMTSSTFEHPLPDQYRDRATSAHDKWGQPIYGKWLVYPEKGAAGLWTTPTDLAILAKEIMLSRQDQSNKVLSKDMVDQMLTPQVEDVPFMEPLDFDWGLGWQLFNLGKNTYFVHGGDNPEGFQSLLIALPEKGWGAVIMTNGVNGSSLYFEILSSIAEAYGLLPSLRALAVMGYLIFLFLSLLIVWLITYLALRFWPKKSDRSATPQRKSVFSRYCVVFLLLIPVAMLLGAISYYFTLEIVTTIATVPSLETHQSPEALSMIERGNLFAQHGMIEEAIAVYAEAQNIEPELDISAGDWNNLCWYGSLWGYAEDVMDECDRAVALAPESAGIKDSRGLARALTGDYPGAIEDFREYVDWLEKHGGIEYEKSQRKFWISELESGRNPFDEAILMKLR
jgi:CubicO group peptidase (beta-lactamase class C family)